LRWSHESMYGVVACFQGTVRILGEDTELHAPLIGVQAARLFQAIRTVAQTGVWIAFLTPIMTGQTIARDMACPGTITASSMSPIDPRAAIAFSILLRSRENLEIGESFIDGMREAGATISPDGSLALNVTFLVTEYSGSSASPTLHADFAWIKRPDPPDHAAARRPTLRLTAALLKKQEGDLIWVATVECTVTTLDAHLIAHDLGVVVATYFGKQVSNKF
jgi:hypothetical protein